MSRQAAKTAPYGTWTSPITADLVVGETVRLGKVAIDGDRTYWTELRPAEKGRTVLVARDPDGTTRVVTPEGMSVRSRVHEYGDGGAFAVSGDVIFFSNDDDQRLYRQELGAAPVPLTPAGRYRYADFELDPRRGRIVCVREDHGTGGEPKNEIVSLDSTSGGAGDVLATGADFYAAPRLSPDGAELAFLSWDHPNMPWDGTDLRVAAIGEEGGAGASERVAGGPTESIFQPAWSAEGALHFVSDRSGFWNLYRLAADRAAPPEQIVEMDAEIGKPYWMFGMTTYGISSRGRVVFTYGRRGTWKLASALAGGGEPAPLKVPDTEIEWLAVEGTRAVYVGGSPTSPPAVVAVDLESSAREVLRSASTVEIDAGYLSEPEAIEFPTGGGDTAHAFYYPPQNRDFRPPEGEAPPLLVFSHGGPTGATSSSLRLSIQFWTSRGFALVDVNYRGSTGYGRAYRRALSGRWGIADVEDCETAARYLAKTGRADPRRLAIRGGSAGGYTTLQALTMTETFAAGASHFGVSDLTALAEHTHKFESRYLDSLVGPYPEQADTYRERSPIEHADRLSSPVIFFQGLEDKVVPPEQSERMVEALRAKGIPVAYLAFEGEQHGFRRAENLRRSLEAELYFYGRVLGFEPADRIDPVPIENL